jgi:hypothetical protein
MKKIFIVRGSEDGNLGVYSNVKLAYERSCDYLDQCEEQPSLTYNQVCKEVKGWGCTIYSKGRNYGGVSVTIETHYLNG